MRTGQLLVSTVDGAAVMVVRAADDDVVLTCGGAEMVDARDAVTSPGSEPGTADTGSVLLGKRYATPDGSIELLCTKPGAGPLAVNGAELLVKAAKQLPSSD